MISRSWFIPVTIEICQSVLSYDQDRGVLLTQSTFLFRHRLFFIPPFPFLGCIVFFFICFVFVWGTLLFFLFVLFLSDGSLTFFFFLLSLIIDLCFRFLVFLGKVTVGGGVDLDDWSEVHLVTTAAGDWFAVRWVAIAGDWLEVRWVIAAGVWLVERWLTGEGDWL